MHCRDLGCGRWPYAGYAAPVTCDWTYQASSITAHHAAAGKSLARVVMGTDGLRCLLRMTSTMTILFRALFPMMLLTLSGCDRSSIQQHDDGKPPAGSSASAGKGASPGAPARLASGNIARAATAFGFGPHVPLAREEGGSMADYEAVVVGDFNGELRSNLRRWREFQALAP